MDIYRIDGSKTIRIADMATAPPEQHADKETNKTQIKAHIKRMSALQEKLYAENDYTLLLIFQAMDAAGKDGMIRHVTTGLNPQGTQVFSFKQPSREELDHDFLWRAHKAAPERGRVGIFNRSYYEDVLVVRVHNMIDARQIPKALINEQIWDDRLADIKNYEAYMRRNGQITLKFFLNVSKEEQKRRFLARIDNPSKNWKFSAADLREREYWDDYMFCYEQAINKTSTPDIPWYVIPADNKWYARNMVSRIIVETMAGLGLQYPVLPEEEQAKLSAYKEHLLNE